MARFQTATDNNTFGSKGIRTLTPAFGATTALIAPIAFRTYVQPAAITGTITFTIDVTNCELGDEFVFLLSTDANQWVVTFGTGFNASGTVTIPASKKAVVVGYFDGTVVGIATREIGA
jgi:hypothetical protein